MPNFKANRPAPWELLLAIGVVLAIAIVSSTRGANADGEKKPPERPAITIADQAGDLSGYYICKGAETGNKPYSGIVSIAKVGQVYIVTWLVGAGTPFQGLGIRQGDTLAVSWSAPRQGGASQGCNLYRIAGKKLTGRWASLPGNGQMQNETLTFLHELDPEDPGGEKAKEKE